MILMMIIRYISAVLIWILTSLVVLGSLGEIISCLLLTKEGSDSEVTHVVCGLSQRGPVSCGGSTLTTVSLEITPSLK